MSISAIPLDGSSDSMLLYFIERIYGILFGGITRFIKYGSLCWSQMPDLFHDTYGIMRTMRDDIWMHYMAGI